MMKSTLLFLTMTVAFSENQLSYADDELSKAIESWQGEWDTSYGKMILNFGDDGRFKGYYGSAKHALRGTLDKKTPTVLTGSWKHTGSTSNGLIRFELSKDRKSFKGSYTTGETKPNPTAVNWSGTK